MATSYKMIITIDKKSGLTYEDLIKLLEDNEFDYDLIEVYEEG